MISTQYVSFSEIMLQLPQTVQMQGIYELYNRLNMYLLFILTFVSWMLCRALTTYTESKNPKPITSGSTLETIWTFIPSCILALIAVPSFTLLHLLDYSPFPDITLKVKGHQWYWSYDSIIPTDVEKAYTKEVTFRKLNALKKIDYAKTLGIVNMKNYVPFKLKLIPDVKHPLELINIIESKRLPLSYARMENISLISKMEDTFESFLINETDLEHGLRLLQCKPLELIRNCNYKAYVTSTDVLHSWAIPSFGVKIDAVPGRLNEVCFHTLKSATTAYGQCSELCGVNHGFMPIFAVLH